MNLTQHSWTSCIDLLQMHNSRCSPDGFLISKNINGDDSLLFRLEFKNKLENYRTHPIPGLTEGSTYSANGTLSVICFLSSSLK